MADDINRQLAREEMPDLLADAAKIAGLDLGKRPEFASAENISGIRTKTLSFSRRRDSLTIFARDERYGLDGRRGAWAGDDRAVLAACRHVLRGAKIPKAEIADIEVLEEYGAVAENRDGEVQVEDPELLRKVGRARREVKGLPVWSSHLLLGLTRDGAVGELELHWPRISPEVLKEGDRLRSIVQRGFTPPKLEATRVEAVEAGVIHSPAIGFMMDVVPAIRVIYAGHGRATGGKKPVLYLNRHGGRVAMPRQIDIVRPEKLEREQPG